MENISKTLTTSTLSYPEMKISLCGVGKGMGESLEMIGNPKIFQKFSFFNENRHF